MDFYKVKNWISIKFNVDYRKIKIRNNNNIKFVNAIPIFASKDSMAIAGDLNYIIDIKFDSSNYSISLSNFKIKLNQSLDTINIELLLKNSNLALDNSFILYQIYTHSLNLLKDFEQLNKTYLLNQNTKNIVYNRFTNKPVSKLNRAASGFAGIVIGGLFGTILGAYIGGSFAPEYYLMGYVFLGGELGLVTGIICGFMISQSPYKSANLVFYEGDKNYDESIAKYFFQTKNNNRINLQVGTNQRGLSLCLNF